MYFCLKTSIALLIFGRFFFLKLFLKASSMGKRMSFTEFQQRHRKLKKKDLLFFVLLPSNFDLITVITLSQKTLDLKAISIKKGHELY